MDAARLRTLLSLRKLTFAELTAKSQDIAHHLARFVRRSETELLAEALTDMPEHLRLRVAEIELTDTAEDVIEYLRRKLVDLAVDLEHIEEIIRRARAILVGPHPDQPIDQ